MRSMICLLLSLLLAVLLSSCGFFTESGTGKRYRADAMFVCRPAPCQDLEI